MRSSPCGQRAVLTLPCVAWISLSDTLPRIDASHPYLYSDIPSTAPSSHSADSCDAPINILQSCLLQSVLTRGGSVRPAKSFVFPG
ncbi:hypothetical protein SCHPADRAFT_902572 [Schizopora paradoxa]|uniref:Uncharacterized protein n=1 Tax=Schizopora paradoxa TaxID=27342 RepID=A0A0H2RTU0_9AGAM|nr:hypothetical protein SCHPADRAFT_902572 [Schizopora paradoxa]